MYDAAEENLAPLPESLTSIVFCWLGSHMYMYIHKDIYDHIELYCNLTPASMVLLSNSLKGKHALLKGAGSHLSSISL